MSYLVAAIVVFVLGRSLYLRSRSLRHELMCARQRGMFRLELRRKAELVTHADGCGGVCLPTARETRSVVLLLGLFQLWAKRESVALPTALQDCIDTVESADCDAYFPACFCSIAPPEARSLFHAPA